MPGTSAYRVGIRTNSADKNAVLLLAGGQLVAILVQLADDGHGEERGNWVVEATFGLDHDRITRSFASAAGAAMWIGRYVGLEPFILTNDMVDLS